MGFDINFVYLVENIVSLHTTRNKSQRLNKKIDEN